MRIQPPSNPPATGDCFFYHSMDVPGPGRIEGICDMRSTLPNSVDRVDWSGKRVLEIGPGNGF